MPRQENHAPAESLLGQLQRGRGEGYRRVLTAPKREAWDCLVECISNDPRLDGQVENRAEYYAWLVIETELEMEPLFRYVRNFDHEDQDQGWNTPLAVETLGELAKRGYGDATDWLSDYIGWGQWWDWVLDYLCSVESPTLPQKIARKIEERFRLDADLEKALEWFGLDDEPWKTLARHSTRIARLGRRSGQIAGKPAEERLPSNVASLKTKDILELANERNRHKLRKVIKQVVKPSDLELLKEKISTSKPVVADVALAGMARLAPPGVLPWLITWWSANPGMPGWLRARTHEVMISLPPNLTLPLARERLFHQEWHERSLAEDLLEAHAESEDIPRLRYAINEALDDDDKNAYRLCSLVTAFCNLPGVGEVPELVAVFTQFRYSYGRARAAEAIFVTAPDIFREKLALECLWDCEARTRSLGAKTAPLQREALNRLRQLAVDAFEEEDVRAEAKKRMTREGDGNL